MESEGRDRKFLSSANLWSSRTQLPRVSFPGDPSMGTVSWAPSASCPAHGPMLHQGTSAPQPQPGCLPRGTFWAVGKDQRGTFAPNIPLSQASRAAVPAQPPLATRHQQPLPLCPGCSRLDQSLGATRSSSPLPGVPRADGIPRRQSCCCRRGHRAGFSPRALSAVPRSRGGHPRINPRAPARAQPCSST